MSHANKNSVTNILDSKVSRYMNSIFLKLLDTTPMPTACAIMQKNNKDDIIVVDNNNTPIGIVTDEDILKKIGEQYANPNKTRLDDIMTFPLIGIKHNDTLLNALKIMRDNNVRKVVVTGDDGKIVGMIYQSTISNLVSQSIRKRPKQSSLWGVIWNLGIIMQFAGALMLIPGIVAAVQRDSVVASGIFLMSIMLLITGFFMNSHGEKQPLTLRGTAILVFSSFMALVLFGMIPQLFVIPFDTVDPLELFANGFHESAAGFTTGGLSIVPHPEELPRTFTFYRAYTQFVGGLSFIYLIVTVFYSETHLRKMKGFISGQTLHLRELFSTITIIFSIYAVIAGAALSSLSDRDIFDNFALALSGVSTGGWIPDSQVFQGFTPPEYLVIITVMILGALPFNFHYAFVRAKFLSVDITKEIIVYLSLLIVLCIIFVLSMNSSPLDSIFNMVSGSTTTGYATVSFEKLAPIPFTVMTIAMIIGACGFSTGGGLKIFRLVTLAQIRYIFYKGSRNKLSESSKKDIIAGIIILGVSIIVPLFIAGHLASSGHDFQDSFFDGVSAITTVGLSTGILSDELDPLMKMVFGFMAILGRVEIILIVYMFIPKLMK